MKFVKLSMPTRNGEHTPIWIDADKIVALVDAVETGRRGCTSVMTVTDQIIVEGTPRAVLKKIEQADKVIERSLSKGGRTAVVAAPPEIEV